MNSRRAVGFGFAGVALFCAAATLGVVAHADPSLVLEATAGKVDAANLLSGAAPQTASADAPSASPDPAAAVAGAAEALIGESDRAVTALTQELESEQERLAQLRRDVSTRGKAYVRLVRLGLLPVSGGLNGLVRHANHVESLSHGLTRDFAQIQAATARAERLRSDLRLAEEQRMRLRSGLGDLRLSREATLAARERELAYQRAFQGTEDRPRATVYGSVGAVAADADSFIELKGRLPFPVEGRAEVREVDRDAERGPGLELRVDLGGEARCVFAGKVILVGDYAELGHAVVIDHGQGYSTLLAGLARTFVEVGQQLRAGAPVGELAAVAGRGRLYLEVRRDLEPLPPADWFGL